VGSFYVNFTVKGADQQQVADTLQSAGRRAIVTPAHNGYVVAYDEEAESQDTEAIMNVGSLLSREVGRPVLAVLNHDDDVLCYWLFQSGALEDSYNSDPEYFGDEAGAESAPQGNAERLCALLGHGAHAEAVETILRAEHTFELDRHDELARALGLPPWSVGFGYHYAAEGELEGELDVSLLVHVGELEG